MVKSFLQKTILIFSLAALCSLACAKQTMQEWVDLHYNQLENLSNGDSCSWSSRNSEPLKQELKNFLQAGGDINELFTSPKSTNDKISLLMHLFLFSSIDYIDDILIWLLKHGAQPLQRSQNGETIFSMCANFLKDCTKHDNRWGFDNALSRYATTTKILFDHMSHSDRAIILQYWKNLLNNPEEDECSGQVIAWIAHSSLDLHRTQRNNIQKLRNYFESILDRKDKLILLSLIAFTVELEHIANTHCGLDKNNTFLKNILSDADKNFLSSIIKEEEPFIMAYFEKLLSNALLNSDSDSDDGDDWD